MSQGGFHTLQNFEVQLDLVSQDLAQQLSIGSVASSRSQNAALSDHESSARAKSLLSLRSCAVAARWCSLFGLQCRPSSSGSGQMLPILGEDPPQTPPPGYVGCRHLANAGWWTCRKFWFGNSSKQLSNQVPENSNNKGKCQAA